MILMPKGTKDVLPQESYQWHYLENQIREVAKAYCLNEIRTPTFEFTELFLRGVGDTTDVVNKEMYTFEDRGGQSITLKPEGTAGVARSFVENSLYANPQPTKMFYLTPVFRYEKPQKGRLREHHQFGVEIFGSFEAITDVEVMLIALELFKRIGIKKLSLNINSIGCEKCRKDYNQALIVYYKEHLSSMCKTCQERYEKNPLRMLDCKEEACIKINKKAPIILDYLCDDCKKHHEQVKEYLNGLGVEYSVNPYIVRGLDYYTRTVFEFISTDIGAQGTVCGGGRYNNLVSQIGGVDIPAVGFGMGLERLLITMEALGLYCGEKEEPSLYIASLGERAKIKSLSIAKILREKNIPVQIDLMSRSAKAQMKYADKIKSKYVMVLGDSELDANKAQIKNMFTGEVFNLESIDDIGNFLMNRRI